MCGYRERPLYWTVLMELPAIWRSVYLKSWGQGPSYCTISQMGKISMTAAAQHIQKRCAKQCAGALRTLALPLTEMRIG